jgi:hypothetical protein
LPAHRYMVTLDCIWYSYHPALSLCSLRHFYKHVEHRFLGWSITLLACLDSHGHTSGGKRSAAATTSTPQHRPHTSPPRALGRARAGRGPWPGSMREQSAMAAGGPRGSAPSPPAHSLMVDRGHVEAFDAEFRDRLAVDFGRLCCGRQGTQIWWNWGRRREGEGEGRAGARSRRRWRMILLTDGGVREAESVRGGVRRWRLKGERVVRGRR